MATIKQLKKLTNPDAVPSERVYEDIYPVTHERAVMDDNGNNLEQKLQNIESDVQQTIDDAESDMQDMLEQSAVRTDTAQDLTDAQKATALGNLGISGIDDVPTAGSDNLVKSGGVSETYGEYKNIEVRTGSALKEIIASNIKAGETITINIKFNITSDLVRIDDTGVPTHTVIIFNKAVSTGLEETITYTAESDIQNLYVWSIASSIISYGNVEIFVYRKFTNILFTTITEKTSILKNKADYLANVFTCRNGNITAEFSNVSNDTCSVEFSIPMIINTQFIKSIATTPTQVTFNNVDYKFGALYAKLNPANQSFVSFVYSSLSASNTRLFYDENYIYVPIYAHTYGNEIYNIDFLLKIKNHDIQLQQIKDFENGTSNNYSVAITSGSSFRQEIIQNPHKSTTYYIKILTNDSSFSLLAVTIGTGTTDKLYWKATSANSEVNLVYECDEDNVDNIFVWSSGAGVTTSGTMTVIVSIKGISERVSILENEIKSNAITVDINGNGDYTSLQDAIDNANDTALTPKTIIVMPGKYEMPRKTDVTKANNRYLSIIGTDKNNCILYNTHGNYANMNKDDACVQIAGNVYIANLSIVSTAEDYVAEEGSRKMSYCVHFDMDAPANSVCEINNCVLKDDHFCCIGIGLRTDYTIKIINCELDCTIANEHGTSWGAIYCHDGNGASGTQRLFLKNNVIKCQNGKSVILSSPFSGVITADFINNVCIGDFVKASSAVLSNLCFGNNISSMNYTE